MDDLISRSATIEWIEKDIVCCSSDAQECKDLILQALKNKKRISTAYNVDKVCKQLQEMYEYCGTSNCADCKYEGKCEPELVFDIVKAGGVNG